MKLSDVLHVIGDGPFFGAYITALTGTGFALNSIVVTNPGEGYTSAPAVTFSGGGGTGAAATASILNSGVLEITVTNSGSGYTSAPTVILTGGGFTTIATANAILSAATLKSVATAGRSLAPTLVVPILLGSPKKINFYMLRAGTDAESSPNIIRPSDYNGSTNAVVWEWIGINGPGGSI